MYLFPSHPLTISRMLSYIKDNLLPKIQSAINPNGGVKIH